MKSERFPDDPREWIDRAKSNLIQARTQQPGVYLEDLCFQAQQAAEKALKGLILYYRREFPRTHDIAHLLSLIEREHISVPDELRDAGILTRHAGATRYPGVSEPVTHEEYLELLELAANTVAWAESIIFSEL